MPSSRATRRARRAASPAPFDKHTMTQSIMQKWSEQNGFVRFLDGDIRNCPPENLKWVTLKDAMEHVHDWVVDWDMNLSEEERKLVLQDDWQQGLSFI